MPYPPVVFILEGAIACLKRQPRRCKYVAENWRLYWFFGYDLFQSVYRWDDMYKPDRIDYTSIGKIPDLNWKQHNKEMPPDRDEH